jgi:hypothetical protein
MSPIKSIGIIVLSALVMLWSEVYLPIKQSLGLDIFSLAFRMYKTRASTLTMRLELPKLGPEIDALNGSVKQLAEQFATAFTNELYIVVNPNGNRLSLRRGQNVVLEAAISTGKNTTLTYQKRKWVFQTPRDPQEEGPGLAQAGLGVSGERRIDSGVGLAAAKRERRARRFPA